MDGIDRGFLVIADLFQNVNIPPLCKTYSNRDILLYDCRDETINEKYYKLYYYIYQLY